MKLRRVASTAVAALALVLMLPDGAHAATGTFTYEAYDKEGDADARFALTDPANVDTTPCHTLPQTPSDKDPYADKPQNNTDQYAHVFELPNCTGEEHVLKPHGAIQSRDVHLRSVYFDTA
ncbi:hypothetical protein AQI88_41070 [Streptomyces cellostaticus]|uniref:Uncharacterized protein n=1 Tax=Streptomyces cellostaticus TaxID=67285 RepID=A0A117PQT3_9ACTN|nr:hypothetical protein [Streptomyces cellostaticus]KUM86678.1 hypothetical protein AQI88_41070 [Streptomyces cellostaticus]GHI10098.1 hypothetical protein Scel_84190 [Streptomyces cellostaticus]